MASISYRVVVNQINAFKETNPLYWGVFSRLASIAESLPEDYKGRNPYQVMIVLLQQLDDPVYVQDMSEEIHDYVTHCSFKDPHSQVRTIWTLSTDLLQTMRKRPWYDKLDESVKKRTMDLFNDIIKIT